MVEKTFKVFIKKPGEKESIVCVLTERRRNCDRIKGYLTIPKWLDSIFGEGWYQKNKVLLRVIEQ